MSDPVAHPNRWYNRLTMSIWRIFPIFFWGAVPLEDSKLNYVFRRFHSTVSDRLMKGLFVVVSGAAAAIIMPQILFVVPHIGAYTVTILAPEILRIVLRVLTGCLVGIPLVMTIVGVIQSRNLLSTDMLRLTSVTPISDQTMLKANLYAIIFRFRPLWMLSLGVFEFLCGALILGFIKRWWFWCEPATYTCQRWFILTMSVVPALAVTILGIVIFYSIVWLGLHTAVRNVQLWRTNGQAILYSLPTVLLASIVWAVPLIIIEVVHSHLIF